MLGVDHDSLTWMQQRLEMTSRTCGAGWRRSPLRRGRPAAVEPMCHAGYREGTRDPSNSRNG